MSEEPINYDALGRAVVKHLREMRGYYEQPPPGKHPSAFAEAFMLRMVDAVLAQPALIPEHLTTPLLAMAEALNGLERGRISPYVTPSLHRTGGQPHNPASKLVLMVFASSATDMLHAGGMSIGDAENYVAEAMAKAGLTRGKAGLTRGAEEIETKTIHSWRQTVANPPAHMKQTLDSLQAAHRTALLEAWEDFPELETYALEDLKAFVTSRANGLAGRAD